MARLVARIPLEARILDLGCGSAPVLALLAAQGHQGSYLGLDLSQPLLDLAARDLPAPAPFPVQFTRANLFEPGWVEGLAAGYDRIVSFAFLHHIPSHLARLGFLRQVHELLNPAGRFLFSTWHFTRSPRLRARILPWAIANLSEQELEPGDYLLDWRHGGTGVRYVHVIDQAERTRLAHESGFEECETFESDGEEGNLADYSVWSPRGPG